MLSGKDLWDSTILRDMHEIMINQREIFTYSNMENNCFDILYATASRYPDKIALQDDYGHQYSYANFLDLTVKFSAYLQQNHLISKGDHVGLLLYNSAEFCVAFYAIAKLGAIAVPLPSKYREQELAMLVEKSDLDILIVNEDFSHYFPQLVNTEQRIISRNEGQGFGFQQLIENIYLTEKKQISHGGPEDIIVIMFTSGTTSQSKGVVLRNYNIIHATKTYQRLLNIGPDDITLIPIPIYHITGLVGLLSLFIYTGGQIHLHRYFDAKKIIECIDNNKVTFMHGSPTVFAKLLEVNSQGYNLKSLRMLGCGSSYTPLSQQQAFHRWLPHTKFIVIYGMTETSSPALLFPNDTPTSIYATASGKPIPGIEVKVLDEMGIELPHQQVGEIWLRGSVVCEEYYKLDSDLIDSHHWLNTGDMGYFNQDNYVFIVDRKKDMINRGGEKIWSIDVEQELLFFPEIKECAVIGIPHDIYGEVCAAAVVLHDNSLLNYDGIISVLKTRLATFKIPEKIIFINEIPKTPGLKINKKAIREMFSNLNS